MAKKEDITRGNLPATGTLPATPHPGQADFRAMVQQVREFAISFLDPDGYIRSWNSGAELIKGYAAQEVIGKHFSMFHPEEELKTDAPQRELEIARSVGSLDLQGWRLRKGGNRFWAAITITALKDDAGNAAGFVEIARDITEKRGIEEALNKSRTMFERLFENSPDGIVVVDGNGIIRKVNRHAEVIFGYLREELIGREVEYLMPERFQKRHRQHIDNYFKDPLPRKMGMGLELVGQDQDGREFPVDIMLAPIATTDGTWAFAVIRDVTQQRQNEARISELNTELKKQVEQLAATNRELEAFSYSVSHDLRAPLRHVIGFVDLLNSKAGTLLDEKSRHYMEVISDAAKKMGELIDDLLAFSRMGRAEMMRSRVELGVLVSEIVKELSQEEKDREIEWVVNALPQVIGDSSMLRQVIYNLLSNAVKFTRSRRHARVEVGAVDAEGETHVYVKDNGVGFDAAYVEKLFGLFQRLHRSEEFEGTGVGLAIVQRIISRHGGKVWAEGEIDRGATFWFSLPKAKRRAGEG
jgi:PAS domain S-box-containing protein